MLIYIYSFLCLNIVASWPSHLNLFVRLVYMYLMYRKKYKQKICNNEKKKNHIDKSCSVVKDIQGSREQKSVIRMLFSNIVSLNTSVINFTE